MPHSANQQINKGLWKENLNTSGLSNDRIFRMLEKKKNKKAEKKLRKVNSK